MSVLGIIGLIVLGIIICFFVFVLGIMLGYYACYARAYEEAEADNKDISESQKELIKVLKSQNVAYKKMFEESCDVEVTKDKEN